ncbi:HAMP domain-containing histidine kinase [Sphingobacterium sp. N143]|uniref:HAMP domain-containing sensor histidine kinase n=1 Tax=Sphingobacterium sp. N143 TaxID=2746727 RepID=UPI0025751CBD|nr:HAMP domain-containing sensor histidine kinase [Sphingobacterium sp. N143]MDM1295464.1 HAMP domain-containing histidine kinase [Sphingobacterium sp. N143]
MKIRTKIVLLFSVISTLLLVIFALYVSYFTYDSLQTKFFHRLEENAIIVGDHIVSQKEENKELYIQVKRKYLKQLSEGTDHLLRIVKGSDSLRFKPDLPMPMDFYKDVIRDGAGRYMHKDTAFVAVFFVDSIHQDNLIVVSEGIDEYGHDEQRVLDRTLVTGGCLAILLIIFMSFYFADRLLKPIKDINRDLGKVDIANLDYRLFSKFSNGKDELGVLIANLNSMLNRLDISVQSQQSFIGNASHSLKTPLTIIGGEAELAQNLLPKEHEAYYSLETIAKYADKMELIINNLLQLSRMGFKGEVDNKEILRIDELLYEIYHAEKNIHKDFKLSFDLAQIPEDSDELTVLANPDLFFIAFSNIISNAFKYGNGGQVQIAISCDDKSITIQVFDKGIGIPKKDQPHIFTSFYRASNVGDIYGNGLGLVLAKNIFDLHGAELSLQSAEGQGTLVVVTLPKIVF